MGEISQHLLSSCPGTSLRTLAIQNASDRTSLFRLRARIFLGRYHNSPLADAPREDNGTRGTEAIFPPVGVRGDA
jgi:hypothetical protein